jgi:hypothetical protein
MRLDLRLNNNLEILHSVKNITMDDLYRVFFHIRDCHPNTLTSLSYSSKPRERKFYLTDKGNEHVFTNKRDAYIYMMKAYGDFSN